MDAVLKQDPRARFVHCDPVINIVHDPSRPWERTVAEGHRQSQFQGWDLLSGRFGRKSGVLTSISISLASTTTITIGGFTGAPICSEHPLYKPLRTILVETFARYGKPIFVAETGIEGEASKLDQIRLLRS